MFIAVVRGRLGQTRPFEDGVCAALDRLIKNRMCRLGNQYADDLIMKLRCRRFVAMESHS